MGTHTNVGGDAYTYTANTLNQYTQIDTSVNPAVSLTPSYDTDGNATSYPLPADSAANGTLEWDGENRLSKVTRSDGAIIEFEYDYLSRRIAKKVDGGTHHAYLYDGWNMIMEYQGNSSSTPVSKYRFIWGRDLSGSLQGAGGVGGLLSLRDLTNGGDYLPGYDGNGNITSLVQPNSGNGDGFTEVAHYTYDSFGKLISSHDLDGSGFADENPMRFSTKYQDSETGLYYYGYRYYDPVTGRWPSRDPIAERGGVNLYGMVGNNTVNKGDYLGLFDPDDPSSPTGPWSPNGGKSGPCCGGVVYNPQTQGCCGSSLYSYSEKNVCCSRGRLGTKMPLYEAAGLTLEECSKKRQQHVPYVYGTINGLTALLLVETGLGAAGAYTTATTGAATTWTFANTASGTAGQIGTVAGGAAIGTGVSNPLADWASEGVCKNEICSANKEGIEAWLGE